jgi:hypothetical protein
VLIGGGGCGPTVVPAISVQTFPPWPLRVATWWLAEGQKVLHLEVSGDLCRFCRGTDGAGGTRRWQHRRYCLSRDPARWGEAAPPLVRWKTPADEVDDGGDRGPAQAGNLLHLASNNVTLPMKSLRGSRHHPLPFGEVSAQLRCTLTMCLILQRFVSVMDLLYALYVVDLTSRHRSFL